VRRYYRTAGFITDAIKGIRNNRGQSPAQPSGLRDGVRGIVGIVIAAMASGAIVWLLQHAAAATLLTALFLALATSVGWSAHRARGKKASRREAQAPAPTRPGPER
jgi:hypothetical protein